MSGRSTSGSQSNDDRSQPDSDIPLKGTRLAAIFALACFLVVLVSPGAVLTGRDVTLAWPPDPLATGEWILGQRWILGFLVLAPFLLSLLAVSTVSRHSPSFRLVVGNPPRDGTPPAHVAEDEALWQQARVSIETSWAYEEDRIRQSQRRMYLLALIFGDLATLSLTCCVLVVPWASGGDADLRRIACSVVAATATAFLAYLARILLRISGGDATSRTFAWATRSLVLVIIADVGLYAIFQGAMSSITSALLLGIFVGATGDHAIQFLLEKGAEVFKTAKSDPPRKASPLLDIEGMTAAHVERLEEEGILSIHDLAFVPTARLFFATAYSLQQICNWQDRALLLVYVGKKAAEALAEKMDIRGAIDLRAFSHDISVKRDYPDLGTIQESLRKTLDLDEGGLSALVESMAHDEVTMRVRYYWGSAVGSEGQSEVVSDVGETRAQTDRTSTSNAPLVISASRAIERWGRGFSGR